MTAVLEILIKIVYHRKVVVTKWMGLLWVEFLCRKKI